MKLHLSAELHQLKIYIVIELVTRFNIATY